MEKFIKAHGLNILISLVAGAVGAGLVLHSPQTTGVTSSPATGEPLAQDAYQNTESAVISAVEKASPAVVSIIITKDVPILEQYYDDNSNSPLNQFFGNFQFRVPQLRQNGTEEQEIGGGSGFLISKDGLVMTNKHVVSETDASYTVFTSDGEKHEAKVLAQDPVNDVAVLKIEGDNYSFLQFADSDQLKVGQTVIAIGNALSEFDNTVSVGVVSGLSRSIVASSNYGSTEKLDQVIQTDAAINQGNSGGPLLNLNGDVVGVNVAVAVDSENIGFALPSNLVKEAAQNVEETGKISRPYLGVRYTTVTDEIQSANHLQYNYGALVMRGQTVSELAVVPGSPANKAGIVEGDIILEIDGQKIDEDNPLANIVGKKKVGDQVQIKLWHQGQETQITATLEEVPTDESES